MSLETALARIGELQSVLGAPPAVIQPPAPTPNSGSFAGALQQAMANGQAPGAAGAAAAPGIQAAPAGGSGVGQRVVAFAQREVGQTEQPPGSNNSPRIAQYRTAVPGGPVGPWCAYFASWAAKQAGAPLGDRGQGFAAVDSVWAWAQQSGRAIPASSGKPPQPGDLIIWDEHMGIVESVQPDGTIQTIEGNSSDQVARRTHKPGDAIGYVRLG